MLYSNELRNFLFDIISDMELRRKEFIRNPEKDFSRKRKLSFSETIHIILTMEKDSVKRELLKFFEFSSDSPTDAAFNQQGCGLGFLHHALIQTAQARHLILLTVGILFPDALDLLLLFGGVGIIKSIILVVVHLFAPYFSGHARPERS